MKVFAIRLGDWVEIRAAEEAPVALTSSFPIRGKKHSIVSIPDYPYARAEVKDHTFRIKVIAHEGGKRLCSMKFDPFRVLTGVTGLEKGKMVQLDKNWADGFLNPKTRAAYVTRKA